MYGWNTGGSVENCYNTGTIKGVAYIACYVGGVAGRVTDGGKVNNSYNQGNVEGNVTKDELWSVGGICGENGTSDRNRGTINNSYCINNVTYSYKEYNSSNKLYGVTTGIVTEDTLKDYAEVLGEGFVQDSQNINNGYPVLKWQNNIKR